MDATYPARDGLSPRRATLAALARTYLWWDSIDLPGDETRVIAQIMNFGTYEDIRRLEGHVTTDELVEVMRKAQPGWFGDPSWAFWRGRLSHAGCGFIPDRAPRRAFGDADRL